MTTQTWIITGASPPRSSGRRLPLGREAVEGISRACRRGLAEVEQWAETARGAGFEGVSASVRPI
ncbi:hypothetical protein [Sphaerisporangium corydalis]|uniref:Uncharacterized protein n=1 Tax=Sphaerisporangium corydalis TaxID=1441875 RepID=A0ABV9ED83_9ACTN|nr:hypothetical protein [Sphaerisporangium corydalis]